MTRGIYAACTGLINRSRAMNVISNNISNASTAGFKKDGVITSSFGEQLTRCLGNDTGDAPIGTTTQGVIEADMYTSYEQGVLEQTGRSLDFALEGEGFFTLQRPDGGIRLTRNGQFSLNDQGYLSDQSGNLVIGQQGPIYLGQTDVSVNEAGEILSQDNNLDRFLISVPADMNALLKEEGGLFTGNTGIVLPFEGRIKQGVLEGSNVGMVEEMSNVISGSRSFQSCSQIIRMLDSILEKSVNEVGRL